jgi:hypothetical protein
MYPNNFMRPFTPLKIYNFTVIAPRTPSLFCEFFYGGNWKIPDRKGLHGDGKNPCAFRPGKAPKEVPVTVGGKNQPQPEPELVPELVPEPAPTKNGTMAEPGKNIPTGQGQTVLTKKPNKDSP